MMREGSPRGPVRDRVVQAAVEDVERVVDGAVPAMRRGFDEEHFGDVEEVARGKSRGVAAVEDDATTDIRPP